MSKVIIDGVRYAPVEKGQKAARIAELENQLKITEAELRFAREARDKALAKLSKIDSVQHPSGIDFGGLYGYKPSTFSLSSSYLA